MRRRIVRLLLALALVPAAVAGAEATTFSCRIGDRNVRLELRGTSDAQHGDRLTRLDGTLDVAPELSGISEYRLPLALAAVTQYKSSDRDLWLRLHITSKDPLDAGFVDLLIDVHRAAPGREEPLAGRYTLSAAHLEQPLTGPALCGRSRR